MSMASDVELGARFGRGACTVRRRGATARASPCGRVSSSRCPAATTCRTRWPRWRSRDELAVDFDAGGRGARRAFAAPSGGSSVAARPNGVLVVDDYGHHPTEIAAVLAAARATLGRRLVVAFQPHRYSRTRAPDGRVRARAPRRRRDRADRHLRGRRGPDSGRHGRRAGGRRFARRRGARCAWRGRWTKWCRRWRPSRDQATPSSRWAPARLARCQSG